MISIADIPTTTYQANGISFEMITVEKGHFLMGDDASGYDDAKPAHPVTFDHDFEMGQHPVTQVMFRNGAPTLGTITTKALQKMVRRG